MSASSRLVNCSCHGRTKTCSKEGGSSRYVWGSGATCCNEFSPARLTVPTIPASHLPFLHPFVSPAVAAADIHDKEDEADAADDVTLINIVEGGDSEGSESDGEGEEGEVGSEDDGSDDGGEAEIGADFSEDEDEMDEGGEDEMSSDMISEDEAGPSGSDADDEDDDGKGGKKKKKQPPPVGAKFTEVRRLSCSCVAVSCVSAPQMDAWSSVEVQKKTRKLHTTAANRSTLGSPVNSKQVVMLCVVLNLRTVLGPMLDARMPPFTPGGHPPGGSTQVSEPPSVRS